jgi:branched-chain amino acid transport system substrate-binding protein
VKLVITLLIFSLSNLILANEYNVYLDADMTVHKESGLSIKRGIETALDLFHKKHKDIKVNLKVLDHRGNTRRSLANFKKIKKDKKFLAVFGGLHSPPLITNNKYINDNQILTFVPWAAGGPITRSKTKENWIYRLSVDDAQAGGFIAKFAATKRKCTKPFLVLENTPWGKSNERNMVKGLKALNYKPNDIQFFGWRVSNSASSDIAEKISKSNADCIFFVGNGKDAKTIFHSFGKKKIKLPVFSHWGITGGNNALMAKVINDNNLDVSIIQTKFSFLQKNMNKFQEKVKSKILKKYNFKSDKEIQPMSGWVHAFDLTNIMLSALVKENGKGPISKRVKDHLENNQMATVGLIKKYTRPFTKFTKNNPNAHEALSQSDYIMRKYDKDGNLW